MAFLAANSFFCAFSKIATKRTPIKKNFGGFFFKNKKKNFGGPKQQFFKLEFRICFLHLFFYVKRKHHANFHQKILIFTQTPWNFLKMKTLLRMRAPKMQIWTPKIIPDLWLSAVFCPIKKIKSLHPTVGAIIFVQIKDRPKGGKLHLELYSFLN